MTQIEKVALVREFVNSHDGYPIVWILAVNTIDKLESAVKLIQTNPNLSLKEFRDTIGIDRE